MWLLAAFVLVPLIEIALFIQIGGWLTLWPTLGIVIATAAIGTWLVRQEGLRAVAEVRNSLERLHDPLAPLAHGAMILFAGALLLTPGFLTDGVGFALLVPAVRTALLRFALRRIEVRRVRYGHAAGQNGARPGPAPGPRPGGDGRTIEPEFREVEPEPSRQSSEKGPDAGRGTRPPSGWTRH